MEDSCKAIKSAFAQDSESTSFDALKVVAKARLDMMLMLAVQNAALRAENEALRKSQRGGGVTINNTVINNSVNIYPFGEEPTLSEGAIRGLLADAKHSVSAYVKLKHFKDGRPNVRIVSDELAEVYGKDSRGKLAWLQANKDQLMNTITETSLEEVEDWGDDDLAWKTWYITSGFSREGYEDTAAYRNLVKRVAAVFENHTKDCA